VYLSPSCGLCIGKGGAAAYWRPGPGLKPAELLPALPRGSLRSLVDGGDVNSAAEVSAALAP